MTARMPIGVGADAPLTPEQRILVEAGLPLIEPRARDIARRCRGLVTREDLRGVGAIALHEAARTYDEARSPSFLQHARYVIEHRMLDAVRAEHLTLRARVELAMERAFARMSAHHTLDVDLFADPEEKILDEARQGSADVIAAAFIAGVLEAERPSPEDEVGAREELGKTAEALQEAMTTLPPPEREVIALVYERGMTLDEAGRAIQVHAHTAQRRHVRALRRLRKALHGRGVASRPGG